MPALTPHRWRTAGAIAAVACLGLSAALLWPWSTSMAQKAAGGKAPPPVPVKVATVQVQDQALSLSAVGQVQAARQAVVKSRIDGLLTEVSFTEGQQVRQGQVLARLDDRSLRAQVAQAEAELRRLQAQLALAQLDLQRYQDLAAQSAVSTQQRDQQQAQVAQLVAQVQSQQASLSQIQTQLSYTVITAPFSGRVGLRLVDVGNIVRPLDVQGIVTLAQTEPLMVVFSVPQTRLSDVRQAIAQPQGAVVSVAEREGGPTLAKGRLRSADNAVDAGTGSLKLKAELAPPQQQGDRLWPGQFVTVRLDTGAIAGALSVPAAAVQRGLKGPFVWRVAKAEGAAQAQMVPVQPRWQSDTWVVVAARADGLKPGDQVVVDGQSRLKPKAAVRVLIAASDVARSASQP
ncbi:multidrug efflux system membrane fusion protein [Aquabacterium commune]|uniref:Multidrug efflux system membrane fusion protein n=1 Tax=Aquabacterium commune TaxID=70586 RepID=A0A4R6RNK3_9BURK|nr:efflux RND transporter periplasmic adaptor subunit [Aquabacterium commune]TDP88321.1 multidrug efflux system membrane fusion protein [Aquabacterium commune]